MGDGLAQPVVEMMDGTVLGSGNVFADLGFANPSEMSLKAALAHRIASVLTHRNLTQAAMGEALGIPQSAVSRLLAGKLDGFSVERLIHFLLRLDRDVEIAIKKRPSRNRSAQLRIRDNKGVDVVAA
ncbi:MAG: helix-turn-helix domain-containing protein [Paracoccaceae bacterium]